MNPFVVRFAELSDSVEMAAVIREAFAEQALLDPPSGAVRETAESVAAKVAQCAGIVAQLDGKIVGCVLLSRTPVAHGRSVRTLTDGSSGRTTRRNAIGDPGFQPEDAGDALEMHRLAVLPAFQGRRIGRALIDAAENHAHMLGVDAIRVGARIALPQNIALYQRRGYEITEYCIHAGYSGPTYVKMDKRLTR